MNNIIIEEFESEFAEQSQRKTDGDIEVVNYTINNASQSKKYQLGIGNYSIINAQNILIKGKDEQQKVGEILYKYLKSFIPKKSSYFIVGLGNPNILCDSLGSKVVNRVFKSRGHNSKLYKSIVSGIAPNIFANTGIETTDLVLSLTRHIKPDVIIVIDSLATRNFQRLGTSFQISNSSLTPGGAIKTGKTISKKYIGKECVFIGVPLILISDFDGKEEMLCSKDINLIANICSKLIANSLNKLLFPELTLDEISDLLFI